MFKTIALMMLSVAPLLNVGQTTVTLYGDDTIPADATGQIRVQADVPIVDLKWADNVTANCNGEWNVRSCEVAVEGAVNGPLVSLQYDDPDHKGVVLDFSNSDSIFHPVGSIVDGIVTISEGAEWVIMTADGASTPTTNENVNNVQTGVNGLILWGLALLTAVLGYAYINLNKKKA